MERQRTLLTGKRLCNLSERSLTRLCDTKQCGDCNEFRIRNDFVGKGTNKRQILVYFFFPIQSDVSIELQYIPI